MSRILLVEGDGREARAIQGWLGREETVRHAPSALDAIRAAGEERFDVALVDVDLPDAKGTDILASLRLLSPGVRVVLLAPRADPELALEALALGASEVVLKGARLEREIAACLRAMPGPERAVPIETLRPFAAEPPAGGPRRTA